MGEPCCLVTGGCGFVGRHLIAKLKQQFKRIVLIDNLSTGRHPSEWLALSPAERDGEFQVWRSDDTTIYFLQTDAIDFFWRELNGGGNNRFRQFDRVFHLASIVGGRAVIDGDPLLVATDLAIDALFFRWVVKNKDSIGKVLFASSSAAYPIDLQQTVGREGSVALREDMIDFSGRLGQPDMTYGWSKPTGEYLARLAAEKYGVSVACVRPFSGYGEDQDLSYPVPAIAYRAAGREKPMTVWGTGKQARDFVYIDDCIDAMLFVIERVSDGSGINIGTGELTSFIEVAKLFVRIEGYDAEVKPLVDAPVGVQSRYCDPSLINSFGWRPTTSLESGFTKVLEMAHRRRAGRAG